MFYIPTKVYTGTNALLNNKDQLSKLGTKALIVRKEVGNVRTNHAI